LAMILLLLPSQEKYHCKAINLFNLAWNSSDVLFSLLFITAVVPKKYLIFDPTYTHAHNQQPQPSLLFGSLPLSLTGAVIRAATSAVV